MTRLALWISTCAGAGYFPVAPGTVGSAVGLLALAALRAWGGAGWSEPVAIGAVFVAGAWSAGRAEVHFGRTDPGQVVVDEVLGMLVTLALVPVGALGALAGFVLFRVFDIVKPWPARRLERLPGGWGVMADDAMAGVYAHVALRALAWAHPAWVGGA